MDDLTKLTQEELSDLQNRVLNEQERRQRIANMPAQIAYMTNQFVADGGDRETILEAVVSGESA